MKIQHVTINVSSLDKSIRFYQDVLGLRIIDDMRERGTPIVFLGEEEKAAKIELIENPKGAYNGTGISIGFHADDVSAVHKKLTDEGYNPTEIFSPIPQVQFFFLQDPDGVRIQII